MINKILEDWNNRVGGNLNHKKESHLFELGSMLWEQGWSSEQIGELIRNLVEQETKFKGRTKDGDLRYYKTKDALDKALEKGTVEPVEEPDKKDDEPQQDPTKLSGPKDFERPSSDKKSGDDAKKPKKETASEKKKRREQENINTDNTVKLGFFVSCSKASPPEVSPSVEPGVPAGKGELKYLESETKFKYKKPQDSPYPIGTTMDYNQKQIVKSVLQKKLEEAKTEQEKKHYQKQLDYVEKLDDTDTGILYETTDGVIGFKHTSNKKNWNDPHNNTSVRKKGEKINNFVDKLELSDENKQSVIKSTTDAIEKAANIVDNAEQVVEDDTKNLSDSGIEKTSKLLSILEPNTKNYVEQIRTASSIKKQFENEGQDLENATELELMKAVIDLIKSGNAPQDIKKILLKTSDIVSRIRQLNKVGLKQYGGPMDESQIAKHLNIDVNLVREALSDELDVIVDTSRKRKDSMAVAHESVVTDLQEADSKIDSDAYPNNLNGDNGPNQQAYVQSFLEEIHFSRYISGELEGVQSINIGGTPVKPNDFRSCLSKLSDFEGDAETPEGKEQLMEHLRKKIRISPTSTSVSFSKILFFIPGFCINYFIYFSWYFVEPILIC